jgi:acyl-CoA synthetase (AMP-forming)/AMP-acid ligase II
VLISDLLTHVTKLYPQQPALKDVRSGCEWNYKQLSEDAYRFADWLVHLGLKKGDRAVIVSPNTPGHILMLLGCACSGVVATPVNCLLSLEQIVKVINDAQAMLVLYAPTFAALAEADKSEQMPTVRHFVCISDDPSTLVTQLLAYSPANVYRRGVGEPDAIVETDVLYQMYTSGTTGMPKGAMISHRNVMAELTGLSFELHINLGDPVLVSTPYFHGAAVMMSFLALAHAGVCLCSDSLTSSELIRTLIKEQVAYSFVVPGMIIEMLEDTMIEQADFSNLKALIYGAAPTPIQVQQRALECFGQKLVQIGQTEAVMTMTLLSAAEHEPSSDHPHAGRLKSVGREIFGCDVRIFDDNDEEVAVGMVGEVFVRGDTVMVGYYNNQAATAETLEGGWLHTGDFGTVDEDGYIYLNGRKKDLIICNGENVYAREVENVINSHPDVLESAVIGIPHPLDGEQVKAIVVPKSGMSLGEAEVIDYCREALGTFQCPTSVDIVSSLPRNTGGKVLKSALRKLYQPKD